MTDRPTKSADSLHRIADVLGIPVERLFQAGEPHELWAEREYLCLWSRINTKAGRDAALDALRKILDDEGS